MIKPVLLCIFRKRPLILQTKEEWRPLFLFHIFQRSDIPLMCSPPGAIGVYIKRLIHTRQISLFENEIPPALYICKSTYLLCFLKYCGKIFIHFRNNIHSRINISQHNQAVRIPEIPIKNGKISPRGIEADMQPSCQRHSSFHRQKCKYISRQNNTAAYQGNHRKQCRHIYTGLKIRMGKYLARNNSRATVTAASTARFSFPFLFPPTIPLISNSRRRHHPLLPATH